MYPGGNAWPRLLLGFAPLLFSGAATAEILPKYAPPVCANVFFPDEDANNTTKEARGFRLDVAGACTRVTGELNNNYQNNLSVNVDRAPDPTVFTNSPVTNTVLAIANVDSVRTTPFGDFTTNVLGQWLKANNDGVSAGTATVQSLYGSLAGVTAGYTSSLMNFWSGDFLFFATTPNVSIGIVSYERPITDNVKLAVAAESGLPSGTQASRGVQGLTTTSPDVTGRLRYVNDDGLTLHLSGVVRRADFLSTPFTPAFSQTGWATSFGASSPFRITGAGDSVSMQATYAVNAVAVLGTKADISTNEANGHGGPTRGWSVVGSLNHPWSEQFESNLFASYILVDVDLVHANPEARSTRLGANLYWRPADRLRFGAEIGWLHSEIAANGLPDAPFGSLTAVAGFLSAKVQY